MVDADLSPRSRLVDQPDKSRLAISTLRAACWAALAFHRARRDLRRTGLATRVQPPPSLPWGAKVGAFGVLNRTKPTCLERAMVLQAWLRAFDLNHDILVGVAQKGGSVTAHAWVEGIATGDEGKDYTVIHRIAADR